MELVEKLLNGLLEVWPAVIAICLLGYAIACWYYRREVRVLKALGVVLEQRVKSLEQENARLAALLQPDTREAFSEIQRAPNHKIDVPYSPAQVAALPEYRLLLDLGMIRIEKTAPNQTSVSSTSSATALWDRVVL